MVYYVCAGAIGLLVGAGEIVARYRDEPSKAVLTKYVGEDVLKAAVQSLGQLIR